AQRGWGWTGKRSISPAAPTRLRLFLSRHPRRKRATDDRRERRDVPLRHPPKQLEQPLVEEPNRGDDLVHLQHPRRDVVGRPEDPPAGQLPVESNLHERPDPGVEVGGELVRERPIERENRAIDADRDGTGEPLDRYSPSA